MNLKDMMAQQKSRSLKINGQETKTLSIDEYLSDAENKRPYSDEVFNNLEVLKEIQEDEGNKTTTNDKTATENITNTLILSIPQKQDNEVQTEGKRDANEMRREYARKQTERKRDAKEMPNHVKRDAKLNANINVESLINLPQITGTQRVITLYIFNNCRINGSKETSPLTLEHISDVTSLNKNTIKNAIYRLKLKNVLHLVEYKDGRGGWCRYSLSEQIYKEIIYYEDNKRYAKHDAERDAENLSSSSFLINNKTTTKETYPKEWDILNLESLQSELYKYRETISIKTIFNIFKNIDNPLSLDQIQASIDNFTFGLKKYPQENFYNRKTRVVTLLDSFKENRVFIEPNYLNKTEEILFSIYTNTIQEINSEKEEIFYRWLNENKNEKYNHYKSKLSSTTYFDDRTYTDMAAKDFNEVHFKNIMHEKLIKIIGDPNIVEKFERISSRKDDGIKNYVGV